ncbi:hypothetical protein [Algoriphagus sp. A40]|uniref:hypothetical protein n=1 Tax=Algoriphagus sp. A40 TaxID=1945863 RepID=UPI000984315F|nr:hypothetical protein [Algoriphagus sp. A40]OOG77869.1 hypothetical protein B0E43_03660 [Algoriphagus sp. A40]
MNEKDRVIAFFLKKLDEKNFDISQVRRDLEKENYDENEIKIIVKLVDNEIQRKLFASANYSKSMDLVKIGAVLTLIGLAITIGTFLGLIPMGNSFLIAYGPVLAGISLMLSGWSRKEKNRPQPGKFRRPPSTDSKRNPS